MEEDSAKLIPEEELGRLIRILGMLGSAHEGERAAAALKAAEWVRSHQTDWATLLTPPAAVNPVVSVGVGTPQEPVQPVRPQGAPKPHPAANAPWTPYAAQAYGQFTQATQQAYTPPVGNFTPSGHQTSWQMAAMAILTFHPMVLKGGKESDFVQSLLSRGWPKLTDKQATWLADICSRAGISW